MTFEPFEVSGNYDLVPGLPANHLEIGSDIEKTMRLQMEISAGSKLGVKPQERAAAMKLSRTSIASFWAGDKQRQQVTYLVEPV